MKKDTLNVFTLIIYPVHSSYGLELGVSNDSQSSSVRSFQDIEMRLPKFFNKNFVFKMMEFWWYCLIKANRQWLAFQLGKLRKQWRSSRTPLHSFESAWLISKFSSLSESGPLCKSKITLKWNAAIRIAILMLCWIATRLFSKNSRSRKFTSRVKTLSARYRH